MQYVVCKMGSKRLKNNKSFKREVFKIQNTVNI